MIKRISKAVFGAIGAASAFVAIKELFPQGIIRNDVSMDVIASIAICILFFFIFYIISALIIDNFSKIVDKIEAALKDRHYSSYEFILGCSGFIIGLVIANLICIPILSIKFIGIPLTLIFNIIFAYLGFCLTLRFKNDRLFTKLRQRYEDETREKSNAKLLDTSTVIDGRIFDILITGFLEGKLIIPQFVIDELGTLADSQDSVKRGKGRKGLDMLNNMQKEFGDRIYIKNYNVNMAKGVDELLIEAAYENNLTIVTNDFNLNKIAKLKNIKVLNINELANALKPLANVGDEIKVNIIKQGKERQQGIGYLESGTMVVVENTRSRVGEEVTAIVTSVIQTQAGRMIFANLAE